MDLLEAKELAIETIKKHNLFNWSFSFSDSQRSFGRCYYGYRQITLSAPLCFVNTKEKVLDTILHEIAHALCKGHNHNHIWKSTALSIGCSGEKYWKPDNQGGDTKHFTKYLRHCLNCMHTINKVSKTSRRFYDRCPECKTSARVSPDNFVWTISEAWKSYKHVSTSLNLIRKKAVR